MSYRISMSERSIVDDYVNNDWKTIECYMYKEADIEDDLLLKYGVTNESFIKGMAATIVAKSLSQIVPQALKDPTEAFFYMCRASHAFSIVVGEKVEPKSFEAIITMAGNYTLFADWYQEMNNEWKELMLAASSDDYHRSRNPDMYAFLEKSGLECDED